MSVDEIIPAVSSDRPEADVSRDAYGFVPFAKKIAGTVIKIRAPHGLVLSIVGPWGSGKSTLLNFVIKEMRNSLEADQPAIIEFNPWWFKSHEDLTTQFLASFQAEVRSRSDTFKDLGNALGKYADALGTTATIATGLGPVGQIVRWFFGLFRGRVQTVPQAKKAISDRIVASRKQFVFIIDDIDRLAPADIAALFRVIKALADFPNVIYILAFDRSVVARALNVALSVDGNSYMEKVVQSSFTIPAIDQIAIRKKLFGDLDDLLAAYEGFAFSQSYWAQIYFDGIDPFIQKPRDVVRLVNSLMVTYPAVAGEVNPVDFIALEVIRVFEPNVYEILRTEGDYFFGSNGSSDRSDQDATRRFHEGWLALASNREAVKQLLSHIFPKFGRVMGGGYFYESGSSHWRRDLRLCSDDIYPIYFQFGVPLGAVTRRELDDLISLAASDSSAASKRLIESGRDVSPEGTSRAAELLDRICDFGDEIPLPAAEGLLQAIFDIGDEILPTTDEESRGLMAIPNRWRLRWVVSSLLERVPESSLSALLIALVTHGRAISLIVDIVDSVDAALNGKEDGDSVFKKFSSQVFDDLKTKVVERLRNLDVGIFLEIVDFDYIVHCWMKWDGLNSVREKVIPILVDRNRALQLLEKFLRFSRIQSGNDPAIRREPKLDPGDLCKLLNCDWLDVTFDQALSASATEMQRSAVQAFRSARWRSGLGVTPKQNSVDNDEQRA